MQLLKQSTSITIRIGAFVDETDGFTAETGLTISQADIRLSKNGGDFAQSNDSGGATHDENGWYSLTLDATDTGTLGRLDVAIHESGARPVRREYMVVPANEYDSLVSGTDALDVEVASMATDTISAGAVAAAAAQEIADEILKRGASNVEDTASACSLGELLLAAFESAISGTTWTIYKTNHSDTFSTRTVTTDAAANPITEVT